MSFETAVPSTDTAMLEVFNADYSSLHVRVTNKGALHLYTQTLGYRYRGMTNANLCWCQPSPQHQ